MGQISQQLHSTLKGSSINISADSIMKFIDALEELKTGWERRIEALEIEVSDLKNKIKEKKKSA